MHPESKRTTGNEPEFPDKVNPDTALLIQKQMRHRCSIKRTIETDWIRLVCGADAAYTQDRIHAAVVVITFPGLKFVERACAVQNIPFPYIPGLLSFREGPAIIEAFSLLTTNPDLIFLNGHGYAHPRRCGIASHIGVLLDLPAIGVAQHLLTGTAAVPGEEPGSTVPVVDSGEVIGMAVRTKKGTKPVFVSAGHKIDLAQAVDVVLRTTTTHRFPEPLRAADRLSRECLQGRSGR